MTTWANKWVLCCLCLTFEGDVRCGSGRKCKSLHLMGWEAQPSVARLSNQLVPVRQQQPRASHCVWLSHKPDFVRAFLFSLSCSLTFPVDSVWGSRWWCLERYQCKLNHSGSALAWWIKTSIAAISFVPRVKLNCYKQVVSSQKKHLWSTTFLFAFLSFLLPLTKLLEAKGKQSKQGIWSVPVGVKGW